MGEEELQQAWILRKLLHDMDDIAAIEFMVDKLKDTKTNDEFFSSMKSRSIELTADIVSITGEPVQQIELRLRDAASWQFTAGQYLEIIHPNGTSIPLSIASSPAQLPMLSVHYRSTQGATEAEAFDELLKDTTTLTIRGPAGDVVVDAQEKLPLLLISGGTGAAQALSIITDSALQSSKRPITLAACADHERDLYFRDYLDTLGAGWLETVYLVDPNRTADNAGLRWLVEHAGEHQQGRTIICGSPQFVYAVEDALAAAGITLKLESDVYAYAPRDRQGD